MVKIRLIVLIVVDNVNIFTIFDSLVQNVITILPIIYQNEINEIKVAWKTSNYWVK